MNPDMDQRQRHGTVWFDVTGLGQVKRDFQVNQPERLQTPTQEFVKELIEQIVLLDDTLPEPELCQPLNIDLAVGGWRRIYEYGSFKVLLQQPL